MSILHRAYVTSLVWAVILTFAMPAAAQLPPKATVLFTHGHPDDESIFGGGTLPYYSQVLDVPVTVFSTVTKGRTGGQLSSRVATLKNAMDVYAGQAVSSGTTNALGHYVTGNITMIEGGFIDTHGQYDADPMQTWSDTEDGDGWGTSASTGSGYGNIFGMSDGRMAAAWGMAREIRRFRPEVLVSIHDLEGDYGHSDHTATAIATVDAYDLAADPTVDIEGLAIWQPKKLYIRGDSYDNRDTILWPDLSPTLPDFASDGGINSLYHDFFEYPSIGLQTPREVANDGLDEHGPGATHDVTTIYDPNTVRPGNHSEWWTLYRSTVGPDTPVGPFTIAGDYTGTNYTDWARGDFFENLLGVPTSIQGDLDFDGDMDAEDWAMFKTGFTEDLSAMTPAMSYQHGDLDGDLDHDGDDFGAFRALYDFNNPPGSFEAMLASVPEPASWMLAVMGLTCLGCRRRLIRNNKR